MMSDNLLMMMLLMMHNWQLKFAAAAVCHAYVCSSYVVPEGLLGSDLRAFFSYWWFDFLRKMKKGKRRKEKRRRKREKRRRKGEK